MGSANRIDESSYDPSAQRERELTRDANPQGVKKNKYLSHISDMFDDEPDNSNTNRMRGHRESFDSDSADGRNTNLERQVSII